MHENRATAAAAAVRAPHAAGEPLGEGGGRRTAAMASSADETARSRGDRRSSPATSARRRAAAVRAAASSPIPSSTRVGDECPLRVFRQEQLARRDGAEVVPPELKPRALGVPTALRERRGARVGNEIAQTRDNDNDDGGDGDGGDEETTTTTPALLERARALYLGWSRELPTEWNRACSVSRRLC